MRPVQAGLVLVRWGIRTSSWSFTASGATTTNITYPPIHRAATHSPSLPNTTPRRTPQRFTDSCSECPSIGPLLPLVGALLVTLAIYVFYKATGYEDLRPSSSFRIMINHLQVSSLYIAFKLKWPPKFLEVMQQLYDIFAFHIGSTSSNQPPFYVNLRMTSFKIPRAC